MTSQFRCAYCLEDGIPPIMMLTCGHSFCFGCLEQDRGDAKVYGFSCCICRQEHKLYEFIPNIALTELCQQKIIDIEEQVDEKEKIILEPRNVMEEWVNKLLLLESKQQNILTSLHNKESFAINRNEQQVKFLEEDFLSKMKRLELEHEINLLKLKTQFDGHMNILSSYIKSIDHQKDGLTNIILTLKSFITQEDNIYLAALGNYSPVISRVLINNDIICTNADSIENIKYVNDNYLISTVSYTSTKIFNLHTSVESDIDCPIIGISDNHFATINKTGDKLCIYDFETFNHKTYVIHVQFVTELLRATNSNCVYDFASNTLYYYTHNRLNIYRQTWSNSYMCTKSIKIDRIVTTVPIVLQKNGTVVMCCHHPNSTTMYILSISSSEISKDNTKYINIDRIFPDDDGIVLFLKDTIMFWSNNTITKEIPMSNISSRDFYYNGSYYKYCNVTKIYYPIKINE